MYKLILIADVYIFPVASRILPIFHYYIILFHGLFSLVNSLSCSYHLPHLCLKLLSKSYPNRSLTRRRCVLRSQHSAYKNARDR